MLELGKFRVELERLYGFQLEPKGHRVILATLFFLLFTALLSIDFFTDIVSLRVGQVSDRDIVAPRTASFINQTKTRQLKTEVAAGVATVYDLDGSVIAHAEEKATAIFRTVRLLFIGKAKPSRETLVGALPVSLPDGAVQALITIKDAEIAAAEEHSKNLLRRYMQRGVREDEVELIKRQIVAETEHMGLESPLRDVVAGVVQSLLKSNFILNLRETEKRRQVALESVEPVRETVKKGQVLLRKGDVAAEEHIRAMEELGLHQGEKGVYRIVGVAVFVLLVMATLTAFFTRYAPVISTNTKYVALVGLVMLLTLALTKTMHYYSDFAAPIATGSLLIAILFSAQAGILVCLGLALFGVVAWHDPRMLAVALIGGMTGIYTVSKVTHGYSLTKTGLRVAAANMLIIGATGWAVQVPAVEIIIQAAQGALGGIASAIISIGVLPYLENSFNITTPLKLLELAKPTHPLMQQLLLEAPGTYHHSILVGNLAETAAGKIGADAVTVRVGAYFHDIGKTKRPCFFVENQGTDDNPHDKISPCLSTLIVLSHVRDGLDLAREHALPMVVRDIIQQHHGTTLASYFYQKAIETEHGECVSEADFRYEGPRPQSKEAALVMLADSCEAAVRSLGKPNINRIEATVRRIIKERLNDGQLDDCKLTLHNLQEIGDVFIRVLSSMYHKRIEYPETKDVERRKNKNGHCVK